jgi:WD40 repeat protein
MDRMDTVSSLSFSPDGKFVLTDEDWMVRIWEANTGQVSRAIRTMDIGGTISYDAIWSPDGKTIALGSHPFQAGKVVALLDAATGSYQAALVGQMCNVWSIAYGPDAKLIGAGSDCGSVQVWDVKTGVLKGQWTLDGKGKTDVVSSIVFSPDGRQLAAYDLTIPSQQTIRLINLNTGQATLTNPKQH